ncbi:hypothetical protein AB0O16_03505 [Microbacterium sp. NPDC089180]|uniref:hypothetical protein n=1 Tax=unclassified Microbacterium TaxID=2609290 RepID=UPI003435AE34
MRRSRLLCLLTVPLVATSLAGCTADAPTDAATPTFTKSMSELRIDARETSDDLVAAFGEIRFDQPVDVDVEDCAGEEAGIGRWHGNRVFEATAPASTIAGLRDAYATDASVTTGAPGDVEMTPGRSVIAQMPWTLIRDDAGSDLLQAPEGPEGNVSITVFTACGVL